MKVFIAGAAGALGSPLVRQLVEAGHEVSGMTRNRPGAVAALGAKPFVADVFDRQATEQAVKEAGPDAIVHALTAIPKKVYLMPAALKPTNRLRTEGTASLIAAARSAGVGKLVAESISFGFEGQNEDTAKPLGRMGSFQEGIEAVVSMEQQVVDFGGIVLRYGYFYGPGTSINDEYPKALRRRMFPILGKGIGLWSMIHVEDAASATVAALEKGKPGQIYNVVDDSPLTANDLFQTMARLAGAPKPMHVPNVGPRFARQYFNEATGASNAKIKSGLGWSPRFKTFAEGFQPAV
jgi:nucleoside-diphosphate-sugar epimerase